MPQTATEGSGSDARIVLASWLDNLSGGGYSMMHMTPTGGVLGYQAFNNPTDPSYSTNAFVWTIGNPGDNDTRVWIGNSGDTVTVTGTGIQTVLYVGRASYSGAAYEKSFSREFDLTPKGGVTFLCDDATFTPDRIRLNFVPQEY